MDVKTLFPIQQEMQDSMFMRVEATIKSKKSWENSQNDFQGTSKVNITRLQMLKMKFKKVQMK